MLVSFDDADIEVGGGAFGMVIRGVRGGVVVVE